VEGTFVGYDHDEFKADLSNMVGRLDHVFTSQSVSGFDPTLIDMTMLDPEPPRGTTRDYPSDHWPLCIELLF
jgi:endonuclease/exonuclease/phosphatase family metal-dependent hydrolase